MEELSSSLFGVGQANKSVALAKYGDELRLSGPFGSAPLSLGEDGKRLYLGDMKLERQSEQAAQQMLAKFEQDRLQWLAGRKACEDLGEEYRTEYQALSRRKENGEIDPKTHEMESVELSRSFHHRATQIVPQCHLPYVGR